MLKPKLPPPETRPASVPPDIRQPARPEPPPPAYLVHRVRWPGESLSIIAKWYTGDYRNWRTLVEVTPGLKDTRISLGDAVYIPRRLLKTRDRMPRAFVERHRRGASPGSTASGGAPAPTDVETENRPAGDASEEEYTPVPFGPKSYPQ